MEDLSKFLKNELLNTIQEYVITNGIDFDPKKAVDYINSTSKEKFTEIIETARKDYNEAKEALFPSSMLETIFEISIKHGLVQYAKKIIENSKI